MIVFVFLLIYWAIAVVLAILFNKFKITGANNDSTVSAIFWPLTILYYVVFYPFEYIDEKFSDSKSRG